jgi:PAS domain S-box-containing protein
MSRVDLSHLLERFVESASDAIVLTDTNDRIVLWNRGAEELLGRTADEMLGRPLSTLIPAALLEDGEPQRMSQRVALCGGLRGWETVRLHKDGRRIPVCVSGGPIVAGGDVIGWSRIMRDMSRHTSLRDQLEGRVWELSVLREISDALASTMKLQEVLRMILVAVTAREGLGFNRAFFLLTEEGVLRGTAAVGPSSAEEADRIWPHVQGERLSLLEWVKAEDRIEADLAAREIVRGIRVHPDDTANPLSMAAREKTPRILSRRDSPSAEEAALLDLLGTTEVGIVPMVRSERTLGILMADNVITGEPIGRESLRSLKTLATQASLAVENARLYESLERRAQQLEEALTELHQSEEKLVRAEKLAAVGEVTAKIAHDVRNPLVAVGGFARSILKSDVDIERARRYARIIADEVATLERVLNDLLGFASTRVPRREWLSVNELVERTVLIMGNEIEHNDIDVRLQLQRELNPVCADPTQLSQVMFNLLRNALEAMPHGGTLTVATSRAGQQLRIDVSDTGTGISDENKGRVFVPFFTTKANGTGLGLSVVHQIVRNHGGSVDVESTLGRGTTVSIMLPIGLPVGPGYLGDPREIGG